MTKEPTVFICHDSRDKESFVAPLYNALAKKGIQIWYDQYSLTVGDNLMEKIENGLKNCKYGIIVVSPNFIKNNKWPKKEYENLRTKELLSGKKVILPIWHHVHQEEVANYSLDLVNKVALKSDTGMDSIIDGLLAVLKPEYSSTEHFQQEDLAIVNDITELKDNPELKQADLFFHLNDFKKALKLYDEILRECPLNTTLLLKKANTLYRLGHLDKALEHFDKVLELDPHNQFALSAKKICIQNDRNKEQSEVFVERGKRFNEILQYDVAIENFDKAIEFDNTNEEAFIQKANSLISQDKTPDAISCLDRALAINPTNIKALTKKSSNLLNSDLKEAKRLMEKALELEPNNVLVLLCKVVYLSTIRNNEEALAVTKEALKMEPNNVMAQRYYESLTELLSLTKQLNYHEDQAKKFRNRTNYSEDSINCGYCDEPLSKYEKHCIECDEHIDKSEKHCIECDKHFRGEQCYFCS